MKRLIAFLGVALVLVGLRFYDAGLARVADGGVISVFASSGYDSELFMPTGADSYRIDLEGEENADKLLKAAFAEIKFTEMDGKLIYAYSPRIPRSEWVHGQRVNLMIYVDGGMVCAGVPLLKGCY